MTILHTPAPVAKTTTLTIEGRACRVSEIDPGESWDTWDDSTDTPWGLGPEADPIEPALTMGDREFSSWAADQAEPALANPDLFQDAPAGYRWKALTPRAAVLVSTALDRIEPRQAEGRPTAWVGFAPTIEEDAERMGWELGRAGENAAAPKGWDFGRLVAFYRGWLAGNTARVDAEREELEGWIDSIEDQDWAAMYPDLDPLHPIERIEAGHLV